MSLYKFTHILLFKNDAQLKQKSDKQTKKKNQSPKFIKKYKSCKKKHVYLKKKKITITPRTKKSEEKIE